MILFHFRRSKMSRWEVRELPSWTDEEVRIFMASYVQVKNEILENPEKDMITLHFGGVADPVCFWVKESYEFYFEGVG